MNPTFEKLRQFEKQIYAYRYALTCIDYDAQTAAPAGGADARAEAVGSLSAALFGLLTSPSAEELLQQAEAAAGTPDEKAEAEELIRRRREICCLPAREYAAFMALKQKSAAVWKQAKLHNDFASFAPYLEKIVASLRQEANLFDPSKAPYDVFLDRYERGLDRTACDRFFSALRADIVPLLREIAQHGRPVQTGFLRADWPVDRQKQLSEKIMQVWGLDPVRCTIGTTEHPFTTGFGQCDIRITTHYIPGDFTDSMFSVMHEGGHALYELNVDPKYDYTILAGGPTMGLHESQSRLFENYVGRSRAFLGWFWPTLTALFPDRLASVTADEFWRAVNRAEPSLIRTQADELTYSLHIMVRYELEKALMDGSLAVRDLPAAWADEYKKTLGVDVPDDTRGVLQDIHWSSGEIGYFPSYALGSAYAAQAMEDIRKKLDLDSQFAAGDLAPLRAELKERLWKYGGSREPADLRRSLCGGEFDPAPYTRYLSAKYAEVYSL